MKPWLSVVGIGANGFHRITRDKPKVNRTVRSHRRGTERHLELLQIQMPQCQQECISLSNSFSKKLAQLLSRRGTKTCVIASGDPMFYGIGSTLCKHLDSAEINVIPNSSAFSLACSKLNWPMQDIVLMSMHARPVEVLNAHLHPAARILALTSGTGTISQVVKLLKDRGFGDSRITALCEMGSNTEKLIRKKASDWADQVVPHLYTLAIECIPDASAPVWTTTSGLPDDAFLHDGQLTKQEVRSVTLSALKPYPLQTLWDLGAGSGSIAIEWMRAARNCKAIAFECDEQRAKNILNNARSLGVPAIEIVIDDYLKALSEASESRIKPDAIFVGGGLKTSDFLNQCAQCLNNRGRLVANAVTIETENILMQFQQKHGGRLVKIEISHATPIGSQLGWQASRPVTQLIYEKDHEH